MTRLYILAVGLLVTGCTAHRPSQAATPAGDNGGAVAGIDCEAPVPGAAPLLHPGRVIIFGEFHGTREVPALFSRVICESASRGLPTLVGLEFRPGEQQALDAFLMMADENEAIATLLRSPQWVDDSPDGTDSEAMLGLLLDVRRWRRAGAPLHVFTFAAPAETKPEVSDQVMAARLATFANAHPGAVTLVLTGNVHSRKEPIQFGATLIEPMAFWLARFGVDPTTLNIQHSGGTAWGCLDKGGCGAVERPAYGSGEVQTVRMGPGPGAKAHDGVYFVGPITASPPAIEARGSAHPSSSQKGGSPQSGP